MTPFFLLLLLLIFIASILGGLVPLMVRLTHRRMQVALSFVSGILVGISIFDLWPHALEGFLDNGMGTHDAMGSLAWWTIGGFMTLFLLERFVCFHHHDVEGEECSHEHTSRWSGALAGLCVHALLAGMALGAASANSAALLGITLAIILHKPFDSLALGTLLAAGDHARARRHWVNIAYAVVTPLGALLGHLVGEMAGGVTAIAITFATGMLLCIALSDLLPELQFHRHDRILLTVALVLGLALSWGVTRLADHGHEGSEGEVHESHSSLHSEGAEARSRVHDDCNLGTGYPVPLICSLTLPVSRP